MDGIGILGMLILLIVLIGFVGLVTAVALILSKGRWGVAVLVAGLAVFAVPALLVMAFLGLAYNEATLDRPTAEVRIENGPTSFSSSNGHVEWKVNDVPQPVPSFPQMQKPVWAIGAGSLIVLVLIGAFGLMFAMRHGFGHHAAAGHSRMWPVVIGMVVLGIFVLRGVSVKTTYNNNAQSEAIRLANEVANARQQSFAQIQNQQREAQQQLAKQQEAAAQQLAKASGNFHEQIEKADIHELMDKFDAPRITLQAPIVSSTMPGAMIAITLPAQFQVSQTFASAGVVTPPAAVAKSESKAPAAVSPSAAKSPKRNRPPKAVASAASSSNEPFAEKSNSHAADESAAQSAGSAASPMAEAPYVATVDVAPIFGPGASNIRHASQLSQIASPHVAATGPRPGWLDEPAQRSGDFRREVISTEEYATPGECYLAGDVYLLMKAFERLQQITGKPVISQPLPSISISPDSISADGQVIAHSYGNNWNWYDARLRALSNFNITPDYLRSTIVVKDPSTNQPHEYLASTEHDVAGPMKKLYLQVEFTPAIDQQLRGMLDANRRKEGLGYIGLGAFSVLGLLGAVWSFLKIDTATRGYYTKRLFVGLFVSVVVTMYALTAIFYEVLH